MVDIGSLDEIKSINIKDFTKITKFTCSGEELELLLILIENNNLPEISAQFKNNKDKLLSLILNLHYLKRIHSNTQNFRCGYVGKNNRFSQSKINEKSLLLNILIHDFL